MLTYFFVVEIDSYGEAEDWTPDLWRSLPALPHRQVRRTGQKGGASMWSVFS